MTMESTLLYNGVLTEWLLTTHDESKSTLLLAGRCDVTSPLLLVAEAAKFVVRDVNSSSPSSTMRSSSNSHAPIACKLHIA